MSRSAPPSSQAPYIRDGIIMTRLVNPLVAFLRLGTILIVKGRKTGRMIKIPLGQPLEFEGKRYLVAGRGNTNWVRNLRAAGGGMLRSQGHLEEFQAVELTGRDQERVIAEYRTRMGRMVDGMFRQIPSPADHPVFRVQT
ncbi:MAG TPA: nitroreductase/quinone reductase family protein [Candidatus Dormibacteraeota bacterium]|nr:nitroreductase/quinone reductase family protein [Candidatus Dormibacteraeota bacterium]